MEIDDVIYGKFTIPKDVAAIVATPQFQRLKSIKQLGLLRFPNGTENEHHRYGHSLGTYYAASRMLDALEKNTEWLSENQQIPLLYRKAVEIAGLLHDIGHGPFSHPWERIAEKYDHEYQAFSCIDHIFKQIDKEHFPELRCDNDYGINLIKALIKGDVKKFNMKDEDNQYKFIFEIISNKRLKFDVDKWDYLKRDYYFLKDLYQPNMDFDAVFLNARASKCGKYIEYRYEDYDKMYNLCAARYYFHVHCYLSPQSLLCDYILKSAIQEVKPKINNILVKDIDADNMSEFLQFTDDKIMKLIESSNLSKFLVNTTKFEMVDELQAFVNVPSVKNFMPNISVISFYGDTEKLPKVNDTTVDVKKTYVGYCNQSTKIVYYTVLHEEVKIKPPQ